MLNWKQANDKSRQYLLSVEGLQYSRRGDWIHHGSPVDVFWNCPKLGEPVHVLRREPIDDSDYVERMKEKYGEQVGDLTKRSIACGGTAYALFLLNMKAMGLEQIIPYDDIYKWLQHVGPGTEGTPYIESRASWCMVNACLQMGWNNGKMFVDPTHVEGYEVGHRWYEMNQSGQYGIDLSDMTDEQLQQRQNHLVYGHYFHVMPNHTVQNKYGNPALNTFGGQQNGTPSNGVGVEYWTHDWEIYVNDYYQRVKFKRCFRLLRLKDYLIQDKPIFDENGNVIVYAKGTPVEVKDHLNTEPAAQPAAPEEPLKFEDMDAFDMVELAQKDPAELTEAEKKFLEQFKESGQGA